MPETITDILIRHLTWKPTLMRAVAIRIVRRALGGASYVTFPDDIDFADVPPGSRNCIGTAFKMLTKAGILHMADVRRKSKAPCANGRTINGYYLLNYARAETFLKRNGDGVLPTSQPDLPFECNSPKQPSQPTS